MANTIKVSSENQTGALNIGKMWIGVGEDKGPTSSTGFYQGLTPPKDGYTIYLDRNDDAPSVLIANDDSELITLTNQIANSSYTTVSECLSYFRNQTGKLVVEKDYPNTHTEKLAMVFDASYIPSHHDPDDRWIDIAGNEELINNGGHITHNSNGWFSLDGSSGQYFTSDGQVPTFSSDTSSSIEIIFRLNTLPTAQYGDNNHIFGGQVGNNMTIFAYPKESNNKSHIGMCYDDSRYNANHKSTYSIEAGEWVSFTWVGEPHWAIGWQEVQQPYGKFTYYVNGEYDKGPTVSSDYNGSGFPGVVYVGKDTRWNTTTHIDVASIKMYNKALTSEEVNYNYYGGNIVTDGLVAHFDGSKIMSYDSGSRYRNMKDPTSTTTDGAFGNSPKYNSSLGTFEFGYKRNTYISHISSGTTGSFDLPGGDGYSVGIWVKRTAYGTWKSGTTNYDGIWNYYWNHNLHFSGAHTNLNRIQGTGLSGYNINMDEWYYVVTTHDNTANSNNHKVYVNGELAQTSHVNNPSYTSNEPRRFYVGNWDSSWSMVGEVGPYHVYDKMLTEHEVKQNYSAHSNRFRS